MEVSTCHWNMAEKHYNIISDVSRPQKYKHFYFKNQQPPGRGLRVVCGVWWWLFITNVGCNRWYIVDWEELNKALNFTVFGRRKIGQKIFNIENSTLAPTWASFANWPNNYKYRYTFSVVGRRGSVMFVVSHCGVTVYYEAKVNSVLSAVPPSHPSHSSPTQKIVAALTVST